MLKKEHETISEIIHLFMQEEVIRRLNLDSSLSLITASATLLAPS